MRRSSLFTPAAEAARGLGEFVKEAAGHPSCFSGSGAVSSRLAPWVSLLNESSSLCSASHFELLYVVPFKKSVSWLRKRPKALPSKSRLKTS